MWLLEWLGGRRGQSARPRSYDEIRERVERRDHVNVERLNRVEESLLGLTAEAGLEDLKRRMEQLRDD